MRRADPVVGRLETLSDRNRMLTRLLTGGYRPSLLAFLSGGHARVTETALAGLHRHRLLHFVAGRQVLSDRVPDDGEGLTREEWMVWHALQDPFHSGRRPLALDYPEVEEEAIREGLWQLGLWPSPTWSPILALLLWKGLALLLVYLGHVKLAVLGLPMAILVLGLILRRTGLPRGVKSRLSRLVGRVTPHGQWLVREAARLAPPGATVAPDSPLMAWLVAAGAVPWQPIVVPGERGGDDHAAHHAGPMGRPR
jgi:uncharacterized protein (TIGR04222 family)